MDPLRNGDGRRARQSRSPLASISIVRQRGYRGSGSVQSRIGSGRGRGGDEVYGVLSLRALGAAMDRAFRLGPLPQVSGLHWHPNHANQISPLYLAIPAIWTNSRSFSDPLLGDSLPCACPPSPSAVCRRPSDLQPFPNSDNPAARLRCALSRAKIQIAREDPSLSPSLFIKPAHSFISLRLMCTHREDDRNHVPSRTPSLLPLSPARRCRRQRRRSRSPPRPRPLVLCRSSPLVSNSSRRAARPPPRVLARSRPSILPPTLRFYQPGLPARWPSHLPIFPPSSTYVHIRPSSPLAAGLTAGGAWAAVRLPEPSAVRLRL